MTERGKKRASGESAAVAEAKNEADAMTEEHAQELPEESPRWQTRTPKFARMRFDWASPEERFIVQRARTEVETRIVHAFPDAFAVLNNIYEIVRLPQYDANGEVVRDQFGWPVWQRTPDGMYLEDFTLLSRKQMQHLVGQITTRLFAWEQTASDLWAESVFAKAKFEERFAIAFDDPISGTVDDRRSAANRDAAEERYFAIYLTHMSRRADSLVKSMDRLSQRLKDLLAS